MSVFQRTGHNFLSSSWIRVIPSPKGDKCDIAKDPGVIGDGLGIAIVYSSV